jgi:Zn-dependent protease with chaperone function
MKQAPVIAPRRSIAFFALLSLLMVAVSYLFMIFLAVLCVLVPGLILAGTRSANVQLILLFAGGVVVAGTLLWSLIPKREKFQSPGLLLERGEHPKLFAQLDEIAAALKEELPRDVYLIGDVNAFVANRGGSLGMGAYRIMAIGLPLFSVLTVSELRAVLAHEFAHYYGGDTKLGPMVYKAQRTMGRTYQNITRVGSSVRIGLFQAMNVLASFLLKWFFLFFLRVINFISRKQEFRADELASIVAGAKPMREGLKKIHGAGVSWHVYWMSEVSPMVEQGYFPAVGAGFVKFLDAPKIAPQVADAIEKEIAEGKTQPYDSHPPLRERLAALEKMPDNAGPIDDAPAVELLENPREAEWKLLEALNPKLKDKRMPFVDWHEKAERVVIPNWKREIALNASVFAGMTTETLPAAVKEMPQLARKFPDPKGELPTPDQRTERGIYIVSVAAALLLLEHGWSLEAQPGDFYIYRAQERVSVNESIRRLWKGELSAEEWNARCDHWGIRGMNMVSAETMAVLEHKPARQGAD